MFPMGLMANRVPEIDNDKRVSKGMWRITTDHEATEDYHYWWVTGKTTYKDKNGGNRGHGTRWFILECNNPSCYARALVNLDQMAQKVPLVMMGTKE